MIAVSNTTPLRYLIAIGREHLFGQLFEKVFVPSAVYEELTEPRTPEIVRRRVLSLPVWFEVRAVQETTAILFPVLCTEANAKPFCWRKVCARTCS